MLCAMPVVFVFQAEDGIRDLVRSRGLGDVYKRQFPNSPFSLHQPFPPAGDQPEAIEKLVEGILDGLMYQLSLIHI